MYLSLREGVLHLFGEELSCRTTRDYARYAFDLRGHIAEVAAPGPWRKALVLPNSWQPDGELVALLTFREETLCNVAIFALREDAGLEEVEAYRTYVRTLTDYGRARGEYSWGQFSLQPGSPPDEHEWFVVDFDRQNPLGTSAILLGGRQF